ncbi:MAG TPA: Maf family protein [Ktedonobacteraceae bacterium]|nr:Maf family protein [Ktedonobacteraceae bacterium]
MNMFKAPVELLLASASPRRRQIISLLGLPYIVAVASDGEAAAEERYRGPVEEMAQWLAKHKASVALRLPEAKDRLVVTADTTVILESETLGKPRDKEHARELLHALRGRWHHVVTGVVVCTQIQGKTIMHSSSCITPVLMRNYSEAEIDAYIASGDPMDKAGGYGIQNPAFQPTESIDGCYFNVVGLPICTLTELMAEFNVYPTRQHIRDKSDCPWSEKCLI